MIRGHPYFRTPPHVQQTAAAVLSRGEFVSLVSEPLGRQNRKNQSTNHWRRWWPTWPWSSEVKIETWHSIPLWTTFTERTLQRSKVIQLGEFHTVSCQFQATNGILSLDNQLQQWHQIYNQYGLRCQSMYGDGYAIHWAVGLQVEGTEKQKNRNTKKPKK